jgi:hypothetical protein
MPSGSESIVRAVTLLVPVQGLSGVVYPAGTEVFSSGRGASIDAFLDGDWLPLHWWEFAESHRSG